MREDDGCATPRWRRSPRRWPRYVMGAPVINHTDAELVLLESLVGRRPPFLDRPGYQPGRY